MRPEIARIVMYDDDRGFGFVRPYWGKGRFYFHVTDVEDDVPLRLNQTVVIDVVEIDGKFKVGSMWKPTAKEVQ